MELLTAVKQWFQEDLSGRINMAINIAILLAILSTCSTVTRVELKLNQQGSIQPVQDEQLLKKQIIDTIISKLNEAK